MLFPFFVFYIMLDMINTVRTAAISNAIKYSPGFTSSFILKDTVFYLNLLFNPINIPAMIIGIVVMYPVIKANRKNIPALSHCSLSLLIQAAMAKRVDSKRPKIQLPRSKIPIVFIFKDTVKRFQPRRDFYNPLPLLAGGCTRSCPRC